MLRITLTLLLSDMFLSSCFIKPIITVCFYVKIARRTIINCLAGRYFGLPAAAVDNRLYYRIDRERANLDSVFLN